MGHGIEETPDIRVKHPAWRIKSSNSQSRQFSPRETIARRKFRYDDTLESDLATPAGEIAARHRLDRRLLLPLARGVMS